MVRMPPYVCAIADDVDLLGDPGLRRHHQGSEQSTGDLRVGDLMGVIPVGAGLVRDETVGELTSHRHRILSHAGHPIHGIGNITPVPMQRDTIGDRFVAQVHLDQLTLPGADLRPRRGAVDSES